MKYKLGIIGLGNMGGAILSGVENDFEGRILVSTLDAPKINNNDRKNIDIINDNKYLSQNCEYILIAVKPKDSKIILKEIEPYITNQNIVISIMAGVKLASLIKSLPKAGALARVMPNLAAKIGQSCSGIAFYKASQTVQKFVIDLFKRIGKVVVLEEEKMDAVTAISGSGIAYVYYFIHSLIQAGQKVGLSEDESRKLALQTALGGVKMIETHPNQNIEDMVDAVCSKGGTTIEAIKTLKNQGFKKIIEQAVWAAYNKSINLSEENK
ncbi:MAG TPA: pyrroline-5-carboxylate reductase [Clostridiales bacterium]|jgi:pyrroline-5-carboxylate reductase|nr:pyrroline-5-carboxylate reductase [Clostridiales bacterium]